MTTSPAPFHYAGEDEQIRLPCTGKKLARCAYRGSGVRRRHRQDLPPRLPLQLPRYFPHPALEAHLRIAAAAPRFAARPQGTQPPELEHVAIVTPQRRLLGAEPRRIVLGSLFLRRVFVHGVLSSGDAPLLLLPACGEKVGMRGPQRWARTCGVQNPATPLAREPISHLTLRCSARSAEPRRARPRRRSCILRGPRGACHRAGHFGPDPLARAPQDEADKRTHSRDAHAPEFCENVGWVSCEAA
jgi:hypothetical protein